ncbi:MAG: GDSL-type esterase/lipase family protein [Daejeonella sp.]
MKYTTRLLVCFLFVQLSSLSLSAQQNPRFYKDIQAFKKQDSISAPPKNAILFVGSSSFTGWKDVQTYFPEYPIINRGFGGSSLTDVIRYTNDIIIPYQPKQVVVYCGENDFTVTGVNADTVYNRFKTLFELIRKDLPKTHIAFVSLKPSPSRAKYMPEMARANDLIRDYLKTNRRTAYVDVYSKMLLADGTPMPHIFKADKLHMVESGYRIWQKEIQPTLVK